MGNWHFASSESRSRIFRMRLEELVLEHPAGVGEFTDSDCHLGMLSYHFTTLQSPVALLRDAGTATARSFG